MLEGMSMPSRSRRDLTALIAASSTVIDSCRRESLHSRALMLTVETPSSWTSGMIKVSPSKVVKRPGFVEAVVIESGPGRAGTV